MKSTRMWIVLGLLILLAVSDRFVPRRIGDHLQFALPIAGLGCAVASGQAPAYLLRFVGMEAVLQGSKNLLGSAAINVRPDGGLRGFPSGHTTAATFGATGLVKTCLSSSPAASGLVILAAGFTGASRVMADRHTPVQVFAGFLLGWLAQIVSLGWIASLWRRIRRPQDLRGPVLPQDVMQYGREV